jgi:phospholipase C
LTGRAWDRADAGSTTNASAAGTGGAMDVITFDQIQESNVTTALQAVQRLKPRWLRPVRGNNSFTAREPPEAVVFLDGVRFGDLSSLASITANIVDHMQYVTATEATTRYSTGYMGGAIEVFKRRR